MGLPMVLDSFARFAIQGLGTPAPVLPTRHLVVTGLYRHVRNPMYVAVVTILIGEAIFFLSVPVLIEAGIFFILANLFVMGYEEPALRRKFGESYEEYLQTVGRWIPRSSSRVT